MKTQVERQEFSTEPDQHLFSDAEHSEKQRFGSEGSFYRHANRRRPNQRQQSSVRGSSDGSSVRDSPALTERGNCRAVLRPAR